MPPRFGQKSPMMAHHLLTPVERHRKPIWFRLRIYPQGWGSGNNCLEYILGFSPKGRTITEDCAWFLSCPPIHSHKVFFCARYLPTMHIYNSFPATKSTKCPQTLHLNFSPTHSLCIPLVSPPPISLFFLKTSFDISALSRAFPAPSHSPPVSFSFQCTATGPSQPWLAQLLCPL